MTTSQKTILTAVALGALAAGFYFYSLSKVSTRQEPGRTAALEPEQQAALSNEVQQLKLERDRATNALASLAAENEALKKKPSEVLKLRGEVGRLRQEKDEMASSSALSKVTANPESRKMLREQQKLGMGAIYKGLATQLKLSDEQTEKLKDLLADHIMEDVGHVTTALKDKLATEQMDRLFADQQAALQQQVEALLGADGLSQYQDYTRTLLGRLTAEQFKSQLTGTDAEKEEKSKQLRQVLQAAAQGALTEAGLAADYQTVPILNFRNIASETEGERSVKLLDDIYQRASAQSSSFLSPEEMTKFQEFKTTAINNSRMALTLNRTMMAPISN